MLFLQCSSEGHCVFIAEQVNTNKMEYLGLIIQSRLIYYAWLKVTLPVNKNLLTIHYTNESRDIFVTIHAMLPPLKSLHASDTFTTDQ